MKEFKIGKQEFRMPTEWKEITLATYVKMAELDEKKEDIGMPELYLLKVIEALCGVEEGDLDDLTLDMVNELSESVGFLKEEPTWSNTKHIKIEDIDYVFPSDLNKLTMGEYISIKTLQDAQSTKSGIIPYILAIILRPGKLVLNEETGKEVWKQDKFNVANLEWRKELFMNQPVFDLMGPVTFFLNGSGTFTTNIKDSIPEA